MSWNVLSLFAGIGGLDLGLERAGMNVVGQVEIDPYCRRVLARHWPEVPRHDDVRTCVEWWLGEPRPAVDVVAGGFPCQPVSSAGRQLAQADERWLWPEMAAVIRDLRPRYAIMENVPGLLARGMGDVLADLAACGYDTEWDCVPAAAVGALHRRDRVFIVAHAGGIGRGEGSRELLGVGAAGRRPSVANAAGQRCNGRGEPHAGDAAHGRAWAEPARRGENVANAHGPSARHGHDGAVAVLPPRPAGKETGWPAVRHADNWLIEPDVGRVAHGVPARVDRLRGLGNAVVPQVAEHIGRLVIGAEVMADAP